MSIQIESIRHQYLHCPSTSVNGKFYRTNVVRATADDGTISYFMVSNWGADTSARGNWTYTDKRGQYKVQWSGSEKNAIAQALNIETAKSAKGYNRGNDPTFDATFLPNAVYNLVHEQVLYGDKPDKAPAKPPTPVPTVDLGPEVQAATLAIQAARGGDIVKAIAMRDEMRSTLDGLRAGLSRAESAIELVDRELMRLTGL